MELEKSRRHFKCRHCGSYGFPGPADADGVRMVGSTAESPPCPVCAVPLATALLHDSHPVHFCTTCRGFLMPRDTFASVVNVRRAWASDPPVAAAPLDRRLLDNLRHCPTCGGQFMTHPYYGPGNVVIDSCTLCDVIWLDYQELKRIVDAPGYDRGSRTLVPNLETTRTGVGDSERPPGDQDETHLLERLIKLLS